MFVDVCFSFLLSPSFSGKSSTEWSISNLSLVKTGLKASVPLGPVVDISESFHAALIISLMLIIKPKNAKGSSRLVGFHLQNREQLPR